MNNLTTAQKNLKTFREVLGLTAPEFALPLNISTSTIYAIESGRRTLTDDVIEQVANIYRIRPDRLFSSNFPKPD